MNRGRWLGLTLLVWLSCGPLFAAESIPAEEWLPSYYQIFIDVPSVDAAKAALGKTALNDIWQEPDVQAAVKGIQDAVGGPQESLIKKHVGFELSELTSLFKGQVAVAVSTSPDKLDKQRGGVPAIVIVADLGETAPKLDALVDQAIAAAGNGRIQHATEENPVAFIHVLKRDEAEVFFYATVGGVVIASPSKDELKSLLPRMNQRQPDGLASTAVWKAAMTKQPDDQPLLRFFFNAKNSLDAWKNAPLEEVSDQATRNKEQVLKVLDILGVQNADHVATVLLAKGRGIEQRGEMVFTGPRKGLMKAFLPSPVSKQTLALIPRDTIDCAAATLDPGAVWDTVIEVIRVVSETPEKFDQTMSGLKTFEQKAGMSFRDQIAGAIGPTFCEYIWPGGTGYTSFIIMAECTNPEAFDRAIQGICMAAGEPGDVQLLTIPGEVPVRYLKFGAELPIPVIPSYAITKGHVIIALMPQTLRGVLAGLKSNGPSILENPAYQTAMQGMPADGAYLQFCDTERVFPALYQAVLPMITMLTNMAKIDFNVAMLPPPETISRHLFPGGYVASADGQTIKWRGYSPAGPFSSVGVEGVGVVAIGAGMALPALAKARGEARKAKCRSNLRQIGVATVNYVNGPGENRWYPRTLQDLVTPGIIEQSMIFICPDSNEKPVAGEFVSSYESAFDRLGLKIEPGRAASDIPMIWDKKGNHPDGRNVCFFDTHVSFITDEAQFEELMKKLDALGEQLRKEQAPPQKKETEK